LYVIEQEVSGGWIFSGLSAVNEAEMFDVASE